jgi:hypothetical protein
MKESGVTTINITPLGHTHEERIQLIEKVRDLTS